MCAPLALSSDMEPRPMSTLHSPSVKGSISASDDGAPSPETVSHTNPDGLFRGPMLQTIDNKQWIDLDVLSPKLVKELRRQYSPSIREESIASLGKGAARIKAFVRQTKVGLVIRLRRKMSAEQDEVTEIQLVADPVSLGDVDLATSTRAMSELPASLNEISELPDTSIAQELDSAQTTLVGALNNGLGEPLPRYEEPIRTSNLVPGAQVSAHAHKQAGEPDRENDTTTISSLALSQEDDALSLAQESGASVLDSTESQPNEADQFSEGLQMLINSLGRGAPVPKDQATEPDGIPGTTTPRRRLKVANQVTYETETDAEPSAAKSSRKKTPFTLKRSESDRRLNDQLSDIDYEPSDSEEEQQPRPEPLLRKRTVPRRLPASTGAEAIWTSLIRTQSKILGPEHPLVYRAKSDLANSRATSHAKGLSDLSSLTKSRRLAVDTLGNTHPWVSAFIGDLETLQALVGKGTERRIAGAGPTVAVPLDVAEGMPRQQRDDAEAVSPVVETKSFNDSRSEQPPGDSVPQDNIPSIGAANLPAQPILDTDGRPLPRIVTSFHSPAVNDSPDETSAPKRDALGGLWDTSQPPHQPQSTLSALPRLAFGAAMGLTATSVLWLQRNYGPEQPVKPGKVRVRWTCACGSHLFDDFTERRAGAARELEAYLNRPRAQGVRSFTSPTSPGSSSGAHSFSHSISGGPPSSQTSWSTYGFAGQGTMSSGGGDGKGSLSYAGLPLYSQPSPFAEPPWLLTSANEAQFTPKLSHLDMSPLKIRSDKDFALALREHYFTVNKKWWRSLRIRGLTTIEFVQFEVHRNRFADIRKSPDMPKPLHEDYSFEPADLLPPVGSQYLLHMFKHPEDYDGELITYLRSPKKNGRLHLGVGWGVNLVEGFRADRVWLFISGLFALGSLVFAMVWSFEKHSVQGASGVAAYIVSLGVLVVGWLQACLG